MKITIKKNENRKEYKEFEMMEPNISSWIEAMKDGGGLDISPDGGILLGEKTLKFLKALVSKHGLFDGKKLPTMEVNNLPPGFFLTLLGDLMKADGFLGESLVGVESQAVTEV